MQELVIRQLYHDSRRTASHFSYMHITEFDKSSTYIVVIASPVLGSHNLMGCWASLLPEMMSDLYGCQAMLRTSEPWPLSARSSLHWRKSQTRTVASSLQVTNLSSKGEKLNDMKSQWRQISIYDNKYDESLEVAIMSNIGLTIKSLLTVCRNEQGNPLSVILSNKIRLLMYIQSHIDQSDKNYSNSKGNLREIMEWLFL